MKLAYLSVSGLLLFTACGNDARAPGQWPLSKGELEKSAQPSEPGEGTYRRYCIACHGADGRGNGGITGADFLAGRETIGAKADADLAVSVREGKRGERAVMPAHKAVLSDAQIAEAVAYVRKRFLQNPTQTP
jgi:cytochrome c oxidase cbb3-type subunit 3